MRRRSLLVVGALALAGGVVTLRTLPGSSSTSGKVTLRVMAAASLSRAFDEIAARFSDEFPRVSVSLSFAGSATLATQIIQGAAVDVVAMADTVNMDKVSWTGDVVASSVRSFAANRLTILVAEGNPLRIATLADLSRPDVSVVLCDPLQPCGRYANEMMANAGVSLRPDSLEVSAAGVVSRVRMGEADAGISYVSDAVGAEGVNAVDIPGSQNVFALYPIGIARSPSSGDAALAQSFVDFVQSSVGKAILRKAGFISR